MPLSPELSPLEHPSGNGFGGHTLSPQDHGPRDSRRDPVPRDCAVTQQILRKPNESEKGLVPMDTKLPLLNSANLPLGGRLQPRSHESKIPINAIFFPIPALAPHSQGISDRSGCLRHVVGTAEPHAESGSCASLAHALAKWKRPTRKGQVPKSPGPKPPPSRFPAPISFSAPHFPPGSQGHPQPLRGSAHSLIWQTKPLGTATLSR